MTSEIDLSYAGGIIDGEGTIGITEVRPTRTLRPNGTRVRVSPVHRAYAAVSMTDHSVPMWMRAQFGGHLQVVEPRSPRHKASSRWSLQNQHAAEFCRLIQPYLKIKGLQARLLVEFMSDRVIGPRNTAVPDDELARRRCFYTKVRELNHRGA